MMSLSEMGERALAASTKFALESTSPILTQKALEVRRRLLESSQSAPVQEIEAETAAD